MSKMLIFSMIFLVSVLISSFSQVLLKKSALKKYNKRIDEYLNLLVIIAYSIFLVSSFISIYAYKYIPLSMGPILESSGYIYITILGAVIFNEKIGKRKIVGLSLIIVGITIFSL